MSIEKILEIVDDAFSEHISVFSTETVFGTETWIEGRFEFLKQIKEKLEKDPSFIRM